MNAKEFAKKIDGFEYPARELSRIDLEKLAAENGLLYIYGLSDDLVEMGGIISDELSAWEGLKTTVGNKNVEVDAVWSPDEPDCSWLIKIDCPHETFTIVEDGELFCIGIVVNESDIND